MSFTGIFILTHAMDWSNIKTTDAFLKDIVENIITLQRSRIAILETVLVNSRIMERK